MAEHDPTIDPGFQKTNILKLVFQIDKLYLWNCTASCLPAPTMQGPYSYNSLTGLNQGET